MTACASVRPVALPDSFYSCPEPEEYPDNPTLADLVYALNDTYLAWEECNDSLEHSLYR